MKLEGITTSDQDLGEGGMGNLQSELGEGGSFRQSRMNELLLSKIEELGTQARLIFSRVRFEGIVCFFCEKPLKYMPREYVLSSFSDSVSLRQRL